jgi:Component of IIS longevity pathway SMK-1
VVTAVISCTPQHTSCCCSARAAVAWYTAVAPPTKRSITAVAVISSRTHCRRLCAIFKAFMCLNEAGLLEALLSDKFFVRVAGVFEYDPELRGRARHREFLTNVAQFKQILPIEV